jgi:hypothetical protein
MIYRPAKSGGEEFLDEQKLSIKRARNYGLRFDAHYD